jgi:hypothetical protein
MQRTIARILPIFALLAACGQTGQELYPLRVEGAGTATATLTVPARAPASCAAPCACDGGDWQVVLERADVAFGPLYLCASERAEPDLCPESLAELLEVGVIDALDPAPALLGEGLALTGRAQSAMWDYGRSWLFTSASVRPDPSAPGGHSLVLRGTATRGATRLRFAADVDVDPSEAGLYGVQSAPVRHDFVGPYERLLVRVDAGAWVARVNFDELACARASADDEDVAIVRGTTPYNALYGAMTNARLPAIAGESSDVP